MGSKSSAILPCLKPKPPPDPSGRHQDSAIAPGPLPRETTWAEVARRARLPEDYHELSTATRKVRRVAQFDAAIVRRAIAANGPNLIVLNHLDYVDPAVTSGVYSDTARRFVRDVEMQLGHKIDWVGVSPSNVVARAELDAQIAA